MNSLMMHIQYRLLGDDEDWKLRVHVVVIGTLVTIATYYTGRELYDADIGLMAAILSSVFYMLVEFSINARGYITITLIYLLLVMLINRMKTQANRRGWIAIGFLSTLGFFVSPVFLYPMGTLGLWMFLSILLENKGQQRRRILSYFMGSMILGAILSLAIYLPALIVTYGSVSSLSQGEVIRYTLPVENEDFFAETLPNAVHSVFNLIHTGMPSFFVVICVMGAFIAILFHVKLSKNRFPLFLAIPIWLSVQLFVQQTVIFERAFTFLVPIYAILIATGLITAVRFVTRYRLSRLLIAVILGLIIVIPTAYQLIDQHLLFTAWVTGSMPYGREVVEELFDIDFGHTILVEERFAGVLNYYFQRDAIDILLLPLNDDDDFFDNWEMETSLYLINDNYTRMSSLMESHSIKLPDQNFVLEPLRKITPHYELYEIKRIPPRLREIDDREQVDIFWYANPQNVSYEIEDNQSVIFDMYAEQWKLFRYRYGDHWQDYTLSMRVKISEKSEQFEELLIRFREIDDSSYSLGLNIGNKSDAGQIGFRLDVDSAYLGYQNTTPYEFEINRWYDIRIVIEGDTFTAFIDDEQVLQASDQILQHGSIGFLSSPQAKVQITDIYLE